MRIPRIKQGDAGNLPIQIRVMTESGLAAVDIDTVHEFEVYFGPYRKAYSTGEITWDADNLVFLYPYTQEETFELTAGALSVDWRISFEDVVRGGAGTMAVIIVAAKSRTELTI